MSMNDNTYLEGGCGKPTEEGKEMGNALYIVIESATMGHEQTDGISMSFTRGQWELVMACLSLQCDVS